MINRRDVIKLSAAAGLAALPLTAARASGAALQWTYFQADENGFRRTPVLLSGEKDAILIDGGFTLSDGRALADAIRKTGKRLTTIYVTCNDPDYYFGLRPVVEAFPEAKVIAKPATVAAIKANVEAKLSVWGPQLKENGPQTLAEVVIPEISEATSLDLEGNRIEIVEIGDMHDRRYLYVPALQAVFGGVLVDSGIHVWVADTATPESRAAWVKALDGIIARAPKIVVPGHQTAEAPQGLQAVAFTRDYLLAFEAELKKSKDSGELIAAMTRLYPDLADVSTLELGAKVAKGEMKWG